MIGRRKKTFLEMLRLLRAIEADLESLALVQELNLLTLREVLRTEGDIQRHKTKFIDLRKSMRTGRQSKQVSKAIRTMMKRTSGCVDRYQRQLYIWKSFGDALAFAYLDKFSIKHAFFETDRFGVKAAAGMLKNKKGLVGEVAILLEAIRHKVPAVLCDITNILRYGDVCLLGNSDPALLEVKSSPGLNQRGKRQAATLQKLNDFLENDRAVGFRGAPGETHRHSLTVAERTHVDALNRCIEEAQRNGTAIACPEPGLSYAAIYGGEPDYSEMLPSGGGRRMVFMWNTAKNDGAWAPYTPFINTIRDAQHLFDFIEGRLFLIVTVDVDLFCAGMATTGWNVQFRPDASYAVECLHVESGAVMGLSQQFFARIGYECVSPLWMAESQIGAMQDALDRAGQQYGPFLPVDLDELRRKYFGDDLTNHGSGERFD